jgi:predicted acylesterase/phospholipase RssA
VDDGQRTPTLFFRIADFRQAGAEMFPEPVLQALAGAAQPVTAYDIESGKPIDGLRPLPEPWDLPVIFATRMSLALPALFQAVPMYRLVSGLEDDPHLIRDDYGARISRDRSDIAYPAGQGRIWVEELWFSDGGITSNFPIHLFDSPLPLWPTIGINLGGHPNGHQHQDVWLPTDSQARTSPPTPQKGSMFGFAAAIVSTARGWADTSQTFMPAFRGRVAWVRQRKSKVAPTCS